MTGEDRHADLKSLFPRKTAHPHRGSWKTYPRFHKEAIKGLMSTLGQEWDEHRYTHELSRYRAFISFGTLIYPSMCILVFLHTRRIPLLDTVSTTARIFLVLLIAHVVWIAWQSRPGGARRRFFGSIGHALRSLENAMEQQRMGAHWMRFKPFYEGSLIGTFNSIGRAARALFISLQRSWRTWQAPPAVAERAVRLSRPLIDIEIVDELEVTHRIDYRERLALYTFLQDVAAVVVIRREDLIPAVRSEYSKILPVRPRR
jgi:hypothetical protein